MIFGIQMFGVMTIGNPVLGMMTFGIQLFGVMTVEFKCLEWLQSESIICKEDIRNSNVCSDDIRNSNVQSHDIRYLNVESDSQNQMFRAMIFGIQIFGVMHSESTF